MKSFSGRLTSRDNGGLDFSSSHATDCIVEQNDRHILAVWSSRAARSPQRVEGVRRVFGELQSKEAADACRFLPELSHFAAVLHFEKSRGVLTLAADQHGMTPVFYSVDQEGILFSTSPAAVLDQLGDKGVDQNELLFYIRTGHWDSSRTLYNRLSVVRGGHYVQFDPASNKEKAGCYNRLCDAVRESVYAGCRARDGKALTAELEKLLSKSLERTVASHEDTAGLMNGGGLDSSLLGALLSKKGHRLDVFCRNFMSGGFEEKQKAQRYAEVFNAALYSADIQEDSYVEGLVQFYKNLRFPLIHPNTFASLFISRVANEKGVSHLLIGAGADLLFGGLDKYRYLYRAFEVSRFSGWVPRGVRNSYALLSQSTDQLLASMRARNHLHSLNGLVAAGEDRDYAELKEAYAFIGDNKEETLQALMAVELTEYFQPLLYRRGVMAAMSDVGFSFPYVHDDIVHFALNLPLKHKLNMYNSKVIVKRLAAKHLPKEFVSQKKWGSPAPVEMWLKPLSGLLHGGYCEELFKEDFAGIKRHFDKDILLMWAFLDVELWGRICIRGESVEDILKAVREKAI